MAFFETSARSGTNVNETFFHISKLIKDKQQKAAMNNGSNGKTKDLGNENTRST